MTKEQIYSVNGMHCASCEILIEKKLLEIPNIKSVEAKIGEVLIEYTGQKPSLSQLNSMFKKEGYSFSDSQNIRKENPGFFKVIIISSLIILGFLYLNSLGFASFININSKSSIVAFFGLGIIAGLSSCAALVGGLVLSMSKQWLNIYSDKNTTFEKLQPHLMFNIGRIISYGLLGMALGLIGSRLQISTTFTPYLVIAVSIIMVLLGLQMLGVKQFRKFQFTLPKSITKYIADESNFKGKYMPMIMGALTFFLPCGFTITAQGIALLSGNPLQGGLIMASFALGTAPSLILIGLSAVKFASNHNFAVQFSKIAGVLILFFALFNMNNQFNVLGLPSFNDVGQTQSVSTDKDLVPIVNGVQVIKMNASSYGYKPNYFKVRANIPVRWEISDTGTSGCTNAIISNSLFSGQISLTPGKTSVKEFTPTAPGKYKFSCWMGMISGVIEVVGQTGSNSLSNNSVIPSGAKGCGCGGNN